MSKRLEDFIKNNRTEFDELQPRADLWNDIEERLRLQPEKRERKTFSLSFVVRVAALVIMVMGISFVFYLRLQKPGAVDYAAINPEIARQQVQYASLVKTKRTELKNLTINSPELYQEFSIEIAKMDATYKKLNQELAISPNQERVLRAMIRNLQLQSEVLNQQLSVIEQFNQIKDQQNNATKSI